MRVLVACEFSGVVRDAFRARGHDAWSCDLLPCERPGPHLQCDVLSVLCEGWDLLVAHPPCTDLAVSGARWFRSKGLARIEAAAEFARRLWWAPVPRVCLENPVSLLSRFLRRPDQVVQPWQHGHGETKATCLWLSGLPVLRPSCVVSGRVPRVHREPPSSVRWANRSRTYSGVAVAMADQWGGLS